MNRIFNFSAGPSTLPLAVLEQIGNEISDYKGLGLSVMEMSHRSSSFLEIHEDAKNTLRTLMAIPDQYEILFLQGGASTQFSSIPLNLLKENKKADYIVSGSFAKKAYDEAVKYGDISVIASSKENDYAQLPQVKQGDIRPDTSYVHMCVNNTIYGTRFAPDMIPNTGEIPLIADMSSNILSEVYDVNQFGLIYAGAQKNLGPAGLTVVIINREILGQAHELTPTMLNYATHIAKDSMYNTPPTFSIYVAGLVFKWVEEQGGVKVMEALNKAKAQKLYSYLDQSDLFKGTVQNKADRSIMNVTFRTSSEELDQQFIKVAKDNGLDNLKGHRSVGGMRASIYNAMPLAGVERLIEVMTAFESEH